MGLQFIDADGGHLPPGATPPAASSLLAGFGALPAAEKAAFRQCICPRHHIATTAANVKTLAEAQPGDTAGVAGSDEYLYLLKAADPTVANNWVNMLTNLAAP